MKTIFCSFFPLCIRLLTILGIFFFQTAGYCAAPMKERSLGTLDRIVAVVNKEAIPESELNQQFQLLLSELRHNEPNLPAPDKLKKQLLDKIVMEKLQLQKAKETGIELPEADLNHAVEDIAKRNHMTVQQLQTTQEERGVPFSKFKEIVKNQIIISRLQQRELGQNIHVSPEEIDQFLSSSQGQNQTGAEYRLSHILIPISDSSNSRSVNRAKTQIETIMKELRRGADFSKLAVAYSNSESSPGGDLGFRKTPELPSLFAKVVPTLKVGAIHGPIRNESGYHIIKLVEKRIDGVTTSNRSLTKIHVRHILMTSNEKTSDTEVQASLNKIREHCIEGSDFGKLASKHSEEQASVSKGGDLGWITPDSIDAEFYQAISQLSVGEISQPFKTASGWHLAQVLAVRQTPVTSQATRNKASDLLFQRKVEERIATWLKRVRDEAEVQIYLNEA